MNESPVGNKIMMNHGSYQGSKTRNPKETEEKRATPSKSLEIDEEIESLPSHSQSNTMIDGGSSSRHFTDCPICYDTFSQQSVGSQEEHTLTSFSSRRGRLRQLDGCGHVFCRECLVNHCKHAISVREIPICCPSSASEGCNNIMSDDIIEDLLCDKAIAPAWYGSILNVRRHDETKEGENTEWNKYLRFKRLREDPSLVCCTSCDEIVSKNANRALIDGDDKNQLTCPSCGHNFCSIHGDAHSGMTCDQYKPARQSRKSEKVIAKFTKPCSHCGIPIFKESGCDHIVCSSCKDDMCFKCGTHEYLTGDMVRKCKKCEQNFIDHRHIWAYRLTICLSMPFYLPLCLIHIVVMSILAVASLGCFCCFCCGLSADPDKGGPTFHPIKGIRTGFGMIFLPFIDLFRQCGIPCCFGLDLAPDLETSMTAEMNVDDDDDDDDDDVDIESGVIGKRSC